MENVESEMNGMHHLWRQHDIYWFLETWYMEGCQRERSGTVKLLLRRDLSCSLRQTGSEAAISERFQYDQFHDTTCLCYEWIVRIYD